ncbi:unnamed protein product [Ectocarpus sp. 4 AP-2014]
MMSVQLVRLASVKTAVRRTSSGTSSGSESSAARISRRSSFAGSQEAAAKNVGIEVFAHGALGTDALLVASLSNSALLILRIGSDGIRSKLLDWPVAGKIRGMCVSPDLQCVLCATEGLEGVYLLAVDNLGEEQEARPTPTAGIPSVGGKGTAGNTTGEGNTSHDSAGGDGGVNSGGKRGGETGRSGGGGGGNQSTARPPSAAAAAVMAGASAGAAATTARHAPRRAAADTAFPSLVHLASRGEQRKRASGAKARYPSAEPVFIASLGRRGGAAAAAAGDGGQRGQQQPSDDERGGDGRRHVTGAGSRVPRRGGGSRSSPSAPPPFECLWWVTRSGNHFAVIGDPDGEVHFLDLERLDAWVIAPPLPSMARGRVCALDIVTDLAGISQAPPPRAQRTGSGSEPEEASDQTASAAGPPAAAAAAAAGDREHSHTSLPRHLVAVLHTGAVFIVLLEQGHPDDGVGDGGGEGEGDAKNAAKGEAGGEDDKSSGDHIGKVDGHGRDSSSSSNSPGCLGQQYVCLGADTAHQLAFSPVWLDVGRGGGGGGGGGMGVRVIPPLYPPGDGGGGSSLRLRISIVSRAWGNKCAVKILRVAGAAPGGSSAAAATAGDKNKEQPRPQQQQQGWGLDWSTASGSTAGKPLPIRTATVRQVNLPVDHPVPEQHSLAAVDGLWAVIASPPAGGAPARVAVAPLGGPDQSAAHHHHHHHHHPVCVFPLPAGERVSGVALLPRAGGGQAARASGGRDGNGSSCPGATVPAGSWGLVWSDSCVYRVDLGVGAEAAAPPQPAAAAGRRPRLPVPPRHVAAAAGTTTGAIALRRPSPAAVRRARELHAAGRVSEAARVAIEALDGENETSTAVTPARGGGVGSGGGGVTTRMVREELANTLVEWLVVLHVRQANSAAGSRLAPADHAPKRGGAEEEAGGVPGSCADVTGSSARAPENEKSKTKRASVAARARGVRSAVRRDPKVGRPSSARPASKKHEEAASKTTSSGAADVDSPPPPPAVELAQPSAKQLECYLLASRDYDPVLAATLLHDHGETDLAVMAGIARGVGVGGAEALPKVLRVLAESAWPPRLGPRAVDTLCGDETGAAARETIQAGGGSLFAALEPGLKLRLLLSSRSTLLGDGGEGAAAVGEEQPEAVAGAGGAAWPRAGEAAIARARSHLGPIVPALSAEELDALVSKLAHWCKEGVVAAVPPSDPAAGRPSETAAAATAADADCESSSCILPPSPSSPAAAEALEVLVQALCELSGRSPPPGEGNRRAWLRAGCVTAGSPPAAAAVLGEPRPRRRLEWARATSSLCDILADESGGLTGGGGGDGGGGEGPGGVGTEEEGGLPTKARRCLLRVLPIVRGWHDAVGALMRLRGAGCWAAVALQLELSGNEREAASATLHGVVSLLREVRGEQEAPGDAALILVGKGRPFSGVEQSHPEPTTTIGGTPAAATDDEATAETKRVASEAALRVVNGHVFATCLRTGDDDPSDDAIDNDDGSSGGSDGGNCGGQTGVPFAAAAALPAPAAVILARASVLAEALCAWRHFELPLPPLEAALRRRLGDRDGVRVLAAVFFPQLSRDHTQLGLRGGSWDGWRGQSSLAATGPLRAAAATAVRLSSPGPTVAQMDKARELGLAPQFLLALMRSAGKTPAVSAGGRPAAQQTRTPPNVAGLATGPCPLTLMLDHRAGNGGGSSSWLAAAAPGRERSKSAAAGRTRRRGDRADTASAWPRGPTNSSAARGDAPPSSSSAAADGDCLEDPTIWVFSCGHEFSLGHLLRSVVPASVSSVRQATASLQRTQQVVALEYERGRGGAGAACPECAAKELVRLAAAAAATAGASLQRGAAAGGLVAAGGIPAPPPLPPARRL